MPQAYPIVWPVFFASTIYQWKPILEKDHYKDIIIEALKFLVYNDRIFLNAYVVLNNPFHVIWQPTFNYLEIQASFMKFTARKIIQKLRYEDTGFANELLLNKYGSKYQVWKREPLTVEFLKPLYFFKNPNTFTKTLWMQYYVNMLKNINIRLQHFMTPGMTFLKY